MQHYKAATRLLDWTESPYVATYFAVAEHSTVPGAVWLVHVQTILEYMRQRYPEALHEQNPHETMVNRTSNDPALTFFSPLLNTDRMSAQRTHFSISPLAYCDHRDVIAPAVPANVDNIFVKIVIPVALKIEFQKRLRHINVTARTLYPGSDGLGRSITELIYLRTR